MPHNNYDLLYRKVKFNLIMYKYNDLNVELDNVKKLSAFYLIN